MKKERGELYISSLFSSVPLILGNVYSIFRKDIAGKLRLLDHMECVHKSWVPICIRETHMDNNGLF